MEEVSFGAPLLDALNAARALPDDNLPAPLSGTGPEESPRERALGDLLYGLGEALCLDRHLAPELALSKADALAAARGQTGSALLSGWRREAVGGELEQIASGRASVRLQVKPDALSVLLDSAAE